MRIEIRFLRSAVARQVFWVLLAAATLPLLLFAALAYGTVADRLETQAKGRLHEAAKYAGLRVYDRLLSAQTALMVVAAGGQDVSHPPAAIPPPVRKVFRGVMTVDRATGQVHGPDDLALAWQQVSGGVRDAAAPVARKGASAASFSRASTASRAAPRTAISRATRRCST